MEVHETPFQLLESTTWRYTYCHNFFPRARMSRWSLILFSCSEILLWRQYLCWLEYLLNCNIPLVNIPPSVLTTSYQPDLSIFSIERCDIYPVHLISKLLGNGSHSTVCSSFRNYLDKATQQPISCPVSFILISSFPCQSCASCTLV